MTSDGFIGGLVDPFSVEIGGRTACAACAIKARRLQVEQCRRPRALREPRIEL